MWPRGAWRASGAMGRISGVSRLVGMSGRMAAWRPGADRARGWRGKRWRWVAMVPIALAWLGFVGLSVHAGRLALADQQFARARPCVGAAGSQCLDTVAARVVSAAEQGSGLNHMTPPW